MSSSSLDDVRRAPLSGIGRVRGLIGDPLVHFLLIGVCIFVLAQLFAPRDTSRTMHVDATVYNEIVDIFAAARGRVPTESEMAYLSERWLVDETLYREALSRGLDEGDSMIRERINQKMRILVQSSTITDIPDEADLRAYFEANRIDYDTPARLSFSVARIDGTEAEARDAAAALQTGDAGPEAPRIYDFLDRPRPGLVSVFGEDFVGRVEALDPARWQATDSPNGWQAVRVEKIAPGQAVAYEDIKERLQADWQTNAERAGQNEALEALIAGYDVIVEPYDPAEFEARAALAAMTDPVVE